MCSLHVCMCVCVHTCAQCVCMCVNSSQHRWSPVRTSCLTTSLWQNYPTWVPLAFGRLCTPLEHAHWVWVKKITDFFLFYQFFLFNFHVFKTTKPNGAQHAAVFFSRIFNGLGCRRRSMWWKSRKQLTSSLWLCSQIVVVSRSGLTCVWFVLAWVCVIGFGVRAICFGVCVYARFVLRWVRVICFGVACARFVLSASHQECSSVLCCFF